jgi:hypothetical protein
MNRRWNGLSLNGFPSPFPDGTVSVSMNRIIFLTRMVSAIADHQQDPFTHKKTSPISQGGLRVPVAYAFPLGEADDV